MRITGLLFFAWTLPLLAGGLPGSGRGTVHSPLSNNTKPQPPIGAGTAGDSPFVYRQVGYLATVGPAPLRFGPPSPGCNERTPPRVSPTSKKAGAVSSATTSSPSVTVTDSYPSGAATIITGGSAPGSSEDLINFFRPQEADPELQRRRLRFLFDPVPGFQSAPPPVPVTPATTAPPSRATYRQN
ncbi:MAG: hypothetical protein RLZZ399_2007 [Verrucomicrobiota bacterium]|jgi:hypothetical protein